MSSIHTTKDKKKDEKDSSFTTFFASRTNLEAMLFIFCAGFMVFFYSVFNPFVLDDVSQIVYNPYVTSIGNIPLFFYSSVSTPGISGMTVFLYQYKPLLYTIYTILVSIFGLNPIPFHLLQICLHIINAILIFLLFSYFLKRSYSFFLSLLFLVHPINSEAVIYIADLQDTLFLMFGLCAFYIFVKSKNGLLSYKKTVIISFLLFLSLLSKNTGVLFLFIFPLYAFLLSRINIKRISIVSVIVLLVYLVINLISYQHILFASLPSLIQRTQLIERIQTIPLIFIYYLETFLIPLNLAVVQEWLVNKITTTNFILPLFLDLAFCACIILFGRFLHKKDHKMFTNYLFFSLWFFLGLGFHLQLFPLDQTVADRWFYFPIVGLLAMLGIATAVLSEAIHKKHALMFCLQIIVWILLTDLAILTIIRTTQWHTELQLYSHDIMYSPDSALLNNNLGVALEEAGDMKDAKQYLERAVVLDPNGMYLSSLGQYYEETKNYSKAKAFYWQDIHLQNGMPKYDSYGGIVRIDLFNVNNPHEAKTLAGTAFKKYPAESLLLAYIAMADYQTGDEKDAVFAAQELLTYQPNPDNKELYLLIKAGKFNINNVP